MGRYTTDVNVRLAIDLSDPAKVSNDIIDAAISAAEDAIDLYTDVCWVPTDKTFLLEGTNKDRIVIPELYVRSVKAILDGFEPLDPTCVEIFPGETLKAPFIWQYGKAYKITVSVGVYDTPTDLVELVARLGAQEIARVLMLRAHQRNTGSQVINEHGQFTFKSGEMPFQDEATRKLLMQLEEERLAL